MRALRFAVALPCLVVGLVAGCSSKSDPASASGTDTGTGAVDTGVVADAAPIEDTPAAILYPEGPYGIEIGNTFPDLTYDGYKDAVGDWTKISLHDFYDPDGSRGINAIYFVVSAQWCVPCQGEAKQLARLNDLYKPSGAHFVSAMLQMSSGAPADQKTVDQWIAAYKLDFDIVAAPTPLGGSEGMAKSEIVPAKWAIPRNYVIDPRNMKVYRVIMSALAPDQPSIPVLNLLIRQNGATPPG